MKERFFKACPKKMEDPRLSKRRRQWYLFKPSIFKGWRSPSGPSSNFQFSCDSYLPSRFACLRLSKL